MINSDKFEQLFFRYCVCEGEGLGVGTYGGTTCALAPNVKTICLPRKIFLHYTIKLSPPHQLKTEPHGGPYSAPQTLAVFREGGVAERRKGERERMGGE